MEQALSSASPPGAENPTTAVLTTEELSHLVGFINGWRDKEPKPHYRDPVSRPVSGDYDGARSVHHRTAKARSLYFASFCGGGVGGAQTCRAERSSHYALFAASSCGVLRW